MSITHTATGLDGAARSLRSEQVKTIEKRMGYFIPHYPRLRAITGDSHFSVVFWRLLYHDDLRIQRGAAEFAITDKQLSEECGLGHYETTAARDTIVAPGIALFTSAKRGLPPIYHYTANYDRITYWLDANGFPAAPSIDGKNPPSKEGKFSHHRQEKPAPIKNIQENQFDDDDVAQARKIFTRLKLAGVEGKNQQRIAALYCNRERGFEEIDAICDQVYDRAVKHDLYGKQQKVLNAGGLIVTRLRERWEAATGANGWEAADRRLAELGIELTEIGFRIAQIEEEAAHV